MSIEKQITQAFHEAINDLIKKSLKEQENRFPSRYFRHWQNPFISLVWKEFWYMVKRKKYKWLK